MQGHEEMLSAGGAMFFPGHWTRRPAPWDRGSLSRPCPSQGSQGCSPTIAGTGLSPRPLGGSRFSFLNLLGATNHSPPLPHPCPVFSSALPLQNYTLILIQEFSYSDYTDPPSRMNEHTTPHPIAAWGLLELPALFRTLTMYAANAMTAPDGLPQPRAQRAATWDMKEGEEC